MPVFAASSTESSAWLAGKPFQGAFSVAESTVADAESIEKAELGKAPAVTKDAKKVMAASFKLTMDDPILGNDPVVKRVDPNKLKRYWSAVGSKRKFDDIKEKPIKEKRKSKKSKKN